MLDRHIRLRMIEAVHKNDKARINELVRQLVDCEQSKQALVLKGYGDICMTAIECVNLVPDAPAKVFQQRKR
jgi:hypothetical protein